MSGLQDMADALQERLVACRLCEGRFAATASGHQPRPVVWFRPKARLLIAGQAPGVRVHASGRPFTDPSGDRLRGWLGLDEAAFYDRNRVAIVPMGFCFPGHDAKGGDLPPPLICARTWRAGVMGVLPDIRLVLAVGGAAMRWHMGKGTVTALVAGWRRALEGGAGPVVWPLPHPSWRNTGWIARNPWFEAELLPELRARVRGLMEAE